MKTDTKKTTSTALDAALAALATAATREASAQAALSQLASTDASGRGPTLRDRLATIVAQRDALIAEDETALARHHAALALDAADVASGDPLALAREPGRLGADLAASFATEARLATQLAEVRESRTARFRAADDATAALTDRRAAKGLPPPVALPFFGGPTPADDMLAAYEAAAAGDVPVPGRNPERMRRLEIEERDVRIALERQIQAEEAAAKERVAARAEAERDRLDNEQRIARDHEEWLAAAKARGAADEELLASSRAREASGR